MPPSEENPVKSLTFRRKNVAYASSKTKRGVKGKEKVEKCLTRAMHNGEKRNPLAGVPRNKYAPFVLVGRGKGG